MSESNTGSLDAEELVMDHRAATDVPADRKCMSCGEKFASEGWHNRLCLRCRKRSEPDFV
jgi:DnaJ-class molecular chaperone